MRPRLTLLVAVSAYMAALNWAYVREISPLFGYYGHIYAGPRPIGVAIVANILATLPVLFMPVQIKRPSHVVLWILYAVVIIPTTLIPFYSAAVPDGSILTFAGVIVACLFMLTKVSTLRPLRVRPVYISAPLFWSLIGAGAIAVMGYLSLRFELGLQIGSLVEVYDTRSAYRDALEVGSGSAAYAVGWQANVINPLLIAHGLMRKSLPVIAVGVVAQVLIFSFTGFKSVFFSGLFLLALLVLIRLPLLSFGSRMMLGLSALVLVVAGIDALLGSNTLTSVFVRRLLVVPGQLSGYYLDFFSDQPKAQLGHSILSGFFEYPYSMTPPRLIGQFYFGNPNTSANAHVWADAYANFGYVGVVLFTFVLGMYLWLFDSLARNLDLRLGALLLGIPAFSLSNSALLTTLATHGLLFALLVVLLLAGSVGSRQPVDESAHLSREMAVP